MKEILPEMSDLLDGINSSVNSEPLDQKITEGLPNSQNEEMWNKFFEIVSTDKEPVSNKDNRLVCKIDRDIADSLDDLDFGGICRSGLVNSIVRAFIETYLDRLKQHTVKKKSLLRDS